MSEHRSGCHLVGLEWGGVGWGCCICLSIVNTNSCHLFEFVDKVGSYEVRQMYKYRINNLYISLSWPSRIQSLKVVFYDISTKLNDMRKI